MPETNDSRSRRDLITRLVPYMALSAIKVGVFASPLSVLTAAANRYNEAADKTMEKVNDLLPLLPVVEKLHMEVVGPNAVSFVLQRRDVRSCAEQYLHKVFRLEGAEGAPAGRPMASSEEARFDYVLRLPSRNVYLKVLAELTDEEASSLREAARRLNPAEVWVLADRGKPLDERMDPVFVSESRILRGRLRSVDVASMLYELFDRRFVVTTEPAEGESTKVVLRLVN